MYRFIISMKTIQITVTNLGYRNTAIGVTLLVKYFTAAFRLLTHIQAKL